MCIRDRNNGVKQGDGLSVVLFIKALHSAVPKIDKRGTKFMKSSAYPDDITIVARNIDSLKDMYALVEPEAMKIGPVVNENKAKYMVMSNF